MRTPVLSAETTFCSLAFEAVQPPRARILEQEDWPIPRVSATASNLETPAIFRYFPLLFEEVDYRVIAQSRVPGVDVKLRHDRDQRLIDGIGAVEGATPSTVVGTLRFRQRVGLSKFNVTVGEALMSVTVEVFPSKLDYLDDFEEMLADIQRLDRALPLRYFDSTYRRHGTDSSAEPIPLDWLAILRSEIFHLGQSFRYANAHPLLLLDGEERLEPAHRLRSVSAITRRAIERRAGAGGSLEVPAIGAKAHVRERVPAISHVDSLDSPEHRWLKLQLNHVGAELGRLQQKLFDARKRQSERGIRMASSVDARSQELEEVRSFAGVISALSGLPIIADTSDRTIPAGFASLRLLQAPGYREATQALLALRLGLTASDGIVEISTAPLGVLYEAWCFVGIVELLDSITGSMALSSIGELIEEETLGTRLVKGRQTSMSFELEDGRMMTLRYNPRYPGPTGVQIPDMELRFSARGQPDLIVLMDAKYRLDWNEQSFDFYRITPPPQDAIDALHRYRDAITMWGPPGEDRRPVVRGTALYPLSASQSVRYGESELARAQDQLGIGAIPFMPGNTEFVEAWLRSLIGQGQTKLSWSGPPHPGLRRVDVAFAPDPFPATES